MPQDRRRPLESVKIDPLAHRPPSVSEAKRNREWERRQRSLPYRMQVTYRGVPRFVNEGMKEIAKMHDGVTVSDVAAAFLQFAYLAHEQGRLDIEAELRDVREE